MRLRRFSERLLPLVLLLLPPFPPADARLPAPVPAAATAMPLRVPLSASLLLRLRLAAPAPPLATLMASCRAAPRRRMARSPSRAPDPRWGPPVRHVHNKQRHRYKSNANSLRMPP